MSGTELLGIGTRYGVEIRDRKTMLKVPPYTLHPTPYTLHPTPWTLGPWTLDPGTLDPGP
eukprot:2752714-Rhodomonas_salina.2